MAIKGLNQLVLAINRKVERGINKSLEELRENIIEKTPIDTGELVCNNEIEKAHMEGGDIIGRIKNKTPYAWNVETGFDDSKIFDYYKRSGGTRKIYYQAGQGTPGHLGARMYTRAFDELKENIILNIKNA